MKEIVGERLVNMVRGDDAEHMAWRLEHGKLDAKDLKLMSKPQREKFTNYFNN